MNMCINNGHGFVTSSVPLNQHCIHQKRRGQYLLEEFPSGTRVNLSRTIFFKSALVWRKVLKTCARYNQIPSRTWILNSLRIIWVKNVSIFNFFVTCTLYCLELKVWLLLLLLLLYVRRIVLYKLLLCQTIVSVILHNSSYTPNTVTVKPCD